MTSMPEPSPLTMPHLERASSDSSSSNGITSDQAALAQAFYQNAFNTMYPFGYLPTPSTPSMPIPMPMMSPVFGYGQQLPVSVQGGFPAYSPHLQSMNYAASPYPLPTIPPRYSAPGPQPGMQRPTGCVSPLDLFGALPTHQNLPATGLTFNPDLVQTQTATPIDIPSCEGSTQSPDEEIPPSPSSSESASEVEKPEPVKKAKKVRPSDAVEAPKTVVLVDGKEVKEVKKRSRTAQACEKCRIRKARCFGGNPCNRCIKRKFVCEFTPTRPRPVVKPEPIKPKARRHSMHTVPTATVPHPLALAPTHSHSQIIMPPTIFPPPMPTHTRHLSMIGQGPTLIPGLDEAPSSELGLGLGLSLGLGLELDTVIDEDSEDSDLEMPGMTNSASSGSGSSSAFGGALSSMSAAAWASSLGITNPETVYSPLIMGEDDIFQFSPGPQTSLPLGLDFQPNAPLSSFGSAPPANVGLNDSLLMAGNDWFGAFRA